MSFDGIFLHKLVAELQTLCTGRISKAHQVSDSDILMTIRCNRENINLMISTSSEYSRIHLTTKEYVTPTNPTSFTMFMRKHIEGNIIKAIYQYEADRVLIIEVGGNNELGDYEEKKIIVEIMGRYSNFIITKNDMILDSLKHHGIFDAKRTMMPNAKYQLPANENKYNPFTCDLNGLEAIFSNNIISSPKDIQTLFQGVSPLFATLVYNSKSYASKMHRFLSLDVCPTIFKNKNRLDFYYINDSFNEAKSYPSLSAMLDDFYYDLASNERIKQKTNDLALFVSRCLKRNEEKLDKLKNELEEAKAGDKYRLLGELLLANIYTFKGNSSSIKVINYYNNEEIEIPLDPKYNININSKMYFKKYQKSKNAIVHIKEQIEKTIEEIEYFSLISSQIKTANLTDILEIQEELNSLKYLTIKKTKGKAIKPKILTYETLDKTRIMVGKNNIQNDLITNKLSLPNEMWFHVKDGPGSHVVVKKTDELTESDIRAGALLASYYSPWRNSSSVAVSYTKIRYLKKIPGKRNCFVTMTHEKTIFIDPNIELINELKVVK